MNNFFFLGGGGFPPPNFLFFFKKIKKKILGGGKKKNLKFLGECNFFLGAISLRRVVVPSPKIVINLPRTYEKLPC